MEIMVVLCPKRKPFNAKNSDHSLSRKSAQENLTLISILSPSSTPTMEAAVTPTFQAMPEVSAPHTGTVSEKILSTTVSANMASCHHLWIRQAHNCLEPENAPLPIVPVFTRAAVR